MVRYDSDGRVDLNHDKYLEAKAARQAKEHQYDNQSDLAKRKGIDPVDARKLVHIQIKAQNHKELYNGLTQAFEGEQFAGFCTKESPLLPGKGLKITTLMKCSSYAAEYFTSNPDETILPLPRSYPRTHTVGDKQSYNYSAQMSYVRRVEIEQHILPWLKRMDVHLYKNPNPKRMDDLTEIGLPKDLLGMIHLYNAMLHLGIDLHFQQNLIDGLVKRMNRSNLEHCHLETLEMTVARFHSRGVPILDPVLSHFIGEYAARPRADRGYKGPTGDKQKNVKDVRKPKRIYLPQGTKKKWLQYNEVNAGRDDHKDDTIIVPPKLQVLGHCIRNWSGVRRHNGNPSAAYTGYPLSVGWHLSNTLLGDLRDGRTIKDLEENRWDTYRLRHPAGATIPTGPSNDSNTRRGPADSGLSPRQNQTRHQPKKPQQTHEIPDQGEDDFEMYEDP